MEPEVVVTVHPKKAEADIQANLKKERLRFKKWDTTGMVERHGLKFVHLPAENLKGGLTLAYTCPKRKGSKIILVSVALCNASDTYNKVDGRYYSAKEYMEKRYIRVRVPKMFNAPELLANVFGGL